MKNIVRALALTAIVGLGAAGAQAQRIVVGVGFGAPVVAAVPPCPGVGYVWTPGYYSGAIFVPGRWVFRAPTPVIVHRDYFHRDYRADRFRR